eukprot:67195-Prorocentrum_minimum.AAC.1
MHAFSALILSIIATEKNPPTNEFFANMQRPRRSGIRSGVVEDNAARDCALARLCARRCRPRRAPRGLDTDIF